jgi:hydrophobic/amphiphilic exporter-1 (mainly G- bacteria), HAE1 family
MIGVPVAPRALAVTGGARNLSAVIGLLMLRGILVTTAIVLREIEASTDVRTVLIQGGRTHARTIPMTAATTILALIPLVLSSGGGLIAVSPATVVIGVLLSSTLLLLLRPEMRTIDGASRRRYTASGTCRWTMPGRWW